MIECYHIDFERHTDHFLGFDSNHYAHAMRRVDNVVANLEVVFRLGVHQNSFPSLPSRLPGDVSPKPPKPRD
jgi:hypothetical protein